MREGESRFAYRRGVAPMLSVFVTLATVELIVVHFLAALWRVDVAVILSAVTLAGVILLVRAILSFDRLPVLVDDRAIVMRVGTMRSVRIAWDDVASVRGDTGGPLDKTGLLNLALIAHPNVFVDLRAPLPGRRAIRCVAHRLDDPAAFLAAAERLGRAT